ncbi:C45 family autoproteolytic acyltransferase/hydolase [Flammeovirga pacifica]|uniref:Peptidase C45 hydrolase domain-containing protein n=1 Tax=Flammeovirga pacifica TaxID=915059 RepID=A0A1S1YUD0_FLAPC|nr:C45 family autoproteolytic acyltransferase/hydolase [Flammeovirga pacifica]OHX64606.1 hypothetical protein NH26_23840 [Flammeovirga pacifica]
MNHYNLRYPLLPFLLCFSLITHAGIPPVYHQIELNDNSSFYTIEAQGDYYEVGLAHGKKFKKEIRYMLNRFKFELVEPMMQSVGLEANYKAYREYCLYKTSFLKHIKQYTPGLYDEVFGISEGAQLSFDDLMVYNISFDELFAILEEMSGKNPSLVDGNRLNGHCSAGAIWNNGKSSVCYSLDWAKMFEGSQALMKYNVDGNILLLTGYVGTVGIQGVNLQNGFSVNAHSKFDLRADIHKGLPSLFFARELMESSNKKEAVSKLNQLPIAVGIGYVITDYQGAEAYELSANQKMKIETLNNRLAISNDLRANADMKISVKKYFNIDEVDLHHLSADYWKHNQDSELRFTMIHNYLKKVNVNTVNWIDVFSKYPIAKEVSIDMPVTNCWIIVNFDKEFMDIQTSPSHPGGLPLESFRIKYN